MLKSRGVALVVAVSSLIGVSSPAAQRRGAKAAKPKIHCRFKLLPPSLICTF